MAQKVAHKRRYTNGVWNRYFLSNLNTRLAVPWTKLFVALRLTPNTVSVLSLLASLAGMAVIAFRADAWAPVAGAGLLILGLWWDHSDGQVARITGKGSPSGALFDTVLDRWIEFGWIAAYGVGLHLGAGAGGVAGAHLAFDWPAWVVLFVVAWAAHSTLYVRWANIQKDIYLLQRELKEGAKAHPEPHVVKVNPPGRPDASVVPNVRFIYIPFSFNRDVSMVMLFVVALLPDWIIGLAVFAFLHSLRGVEKNWYTHRDLNRKETPAMVAGVLDPDYHK